MVEKSIVTFMENKKGLIDICLDGNHFDAEYIEDSFDIIPFNERLRINKVYELEGKTVIDVKRENGEILKSFKPELFVPYHGEIRRYFRNYMKSSD